MQPLFGRVRVIAQRGGGRHIFFALKSTVKRKNENFSKKSAKKIWWVEKKVVILQSLFGSQEFGKRERSLAILKQENVVQEIGKQVPC